MGLLDMRYGVFVPNFGSFGDPIVLAELAGEVERAGWDGLFIWDHILFEAEAPVAVVDPWVALAAIATATSRLRIGTLMTPIARRRPWKLARETASVDQLSGGRLIVGAGLGSPPEVEFGLFGEESDDRVRARKLDEGLAILDGLWSGRPFSFGGDHFQLGRTQFLPTPVQEPRPPVWIAGRWPNKAPFRRAANWDGVFPELVSGVLPTPEDLRQILAYIRRRRNSTAPFDAVVGGCTPSDPARGAELIEPYVEAGLTWWLERIDPDRGFTPAQTRARISAGPPRR